MNNSTPRLRELRERFGAYVPDESHVYANDNADNLVAALKSTLPDWDLDAEGEAGLEEYLETLIYLARARLRWSKINMESAKKAGAAEAVAREVLRRLDAGETVLSRYIGTKDWHLVVEINSPTRPTIIGNPALASKPMRSYVVGAKKAFGGYVMASGGGDYDGHEYLVENKMGWLLSHWEAES